MANELNTNIHPYYNDFDSEKNFHQVLFNPGNPVQARELSQAQSILNNQISIHGKHTFKDGSAVIGGGLVSNKISYVVLADTYNSFPVVLEEFDGVIIDEQTLTNVDTGFYGNVLKIKVSSNKKTLFIDAKKPLTVGNKVKIRGQNVYGTITETGNCWFLGVNEGEYFIQNHFVHVDKQSIILEDFNAEPTGKAGLLYSQEIITPTQDNSLLDPARGTDNFGSIGADRLKINTELKYYSEGSIVPDNFVSFFEIKEGVKNVETQVPIYSELAKEFARRTFDESGNYTVNPFAIQLLDGMKQKIVKILTSGAVETIKPHDVIVGDEVYIFDGTSVTKNLVEEVIDTLNFRINTTYVTEKTSAGLYFIEEKEFSINLGIGKAYIRGFEIEKIAASEIPIRRARDKQLIENYNVVPTFGNYVIVDNVSYFLNASDVVSVTMYDAAAGTGTNIGTATVLFMSYDSGTKGQAACRYKLFLLELNFNSGYSFANVRSFKQNSFVANIPSALIINGEAKLESNATSSLLYKIPQEGVATLSPGGSNSTSYTSHEFLSGAATGTNITFSLGVGSNTYFYGPAETNFVGTSIEKELYHFVNTTTGAVLNVSSIIISNSNRQLDVTFTSNGNNVSSLVPVQFTSKSPRTKTKTTSLVTIPAATLNASVPKYKTSLVDITKIVTATVNGIDILSKLNLDNGQRDTIYDYGTIILKSGQTIAQTHPVLVTVEHYTHSGNGYFSVDSYPDEYKDIPSYISKTSNEKIELTDVIDFRPSKTNNGVPIPNIPISADYEFYLPRRDLVVLYSNGEFGIIEGKADIVPQYPLLPEDAMSLYKLEIPPFTRFGNDVQVQYIDNKRYTMKHIGILDKRINRLEYYTALSLLELSTNNTTIFDENGFERFKNGFLVDNFTGHGVGNVNNDDYKCSIDPTENSCRPPYKSYNAKLEKLSTSNISINAGSTTVGESYTLPYTEETFLNNNIASKAESVNPFLVIDIVGGIECNPSSDDWVDTQTSPSVSVNLNGDQDNWETLLNAIEGQAAGFGTQWNAWQTTWSGTNGNVTTTIQEQTGTQVNLTTETIEQSIGEYVVDVNLAYFMREIDINVSGFGLRPNRNYHVFVDNENVHSMVTADVGYTPTTEGVVRSNNNGELHFLLSIPGGHFRTGERNITVIDDLYNNRDNATSYGEYVFASSGLIQTKQESIISITQPTVETTTVTQTQTVVTNNWVWQDRGGSSEPDPLAQTFFVNPSVYPNGVFLSKATVFIKNKPTEHLPLEIQIRPTVNGYPHSNLILPFSNVFVDWDDVQIPTITDNINSIQAAPTVATFRAPVYLEPGKSYALIVLSSSSEYEAYISVMGQKILGTNTTISSQVSLGSLFKSQNSSTWTAFQNEDLMMKLENCAFSLTPGVITFNAKYVSDIFMNEWQHNLEFVTFSNITNLKFENKVKDSNTLILSGFREYSPRTNISEITEKTIKTDGDFISKVTLSTIDKYVSPVIDGVRNSVTGVQNVINNAVDTEDVSTNGGALAKYITRNIALEEGFETNYITVKFDINQPFGSSIEVYYRAKAADDPDILENKEWVKMKKSNGQIVVSGNYNQFTEVTYVPTTDTITYTENGYTFNSANVIAIKVVFLSTNTSVVPRIRAFRAITTAS